MGTATDTTPEGWLRAATYGRVSTVEQARGMSIGLQQARFRDCATVDGHDVLVELVDAGWSGASLHRRGLSELLSQVDQRRIDAVYVTALDRLTRSVEDLLALMTRFDDSDVTLRVLDAPSDPNTEFGRAMVQMQGVFAELERQMIVGRTNGGKMAAVRAGRWPGGTPPYGYRLHRRDERTVVVVDDTEAQVVATIATGLDHPNATLAQVADALNNTGPAPRRAAHWNPRQLRALIRQSGPAWTGRWPWRRNHDDIVWFDLPSILTEHQHAGLLAGLDTGGRPPTKFPLPRRLSSTHDQPMMGTRTAGRRRYRWRRATTRPDGQPRCDCQTIDAAQIEDLVGDLLYGLLTDRHRLNTLVDQQAGRTRDLLARHDNTTHELDEQIGDVEQQLAAEFTHNVDNGTSPAVAAKGLSPYADRLDHLIATRDTHRGLRRSIVAPTIDRTWPTATSLAQLLESDRDTNLATVLEMLDVHIHLTTPNVVGLVVDGSIPQHLSGDQNQRRPNSPATPFRLTAPALNTPSADRIGETY